MQERRFAFGPFLLNPDNGTLLRNGEPVTVGRRSILLLAAVVGRQGEIVTKTDLIDAAWPGAVVEESNLSVQIALLRRALGPSPGGEDWIVTVPRVGYRFVADATASWDRSDHASSQPTLAVLPFVSLSSDPEQGFFADGLADEIITTLSGMPGLVVIARSSSFACRGVSKDVRRIAGELGARYVVDGSVRTNGGRVRVTVQMSDGSTGRQVWTERYDRELGDVFAVQDDVASRIATKLGVTLDPAESTLWPSISTNGTKNTAAYECLLRGRAMQRGATQNAAVFERTSELFQEAIALDPEYAAPHAALGMALAHAFYNRWTVEPERSLAEAGERADRAIALDPVSAFAHGVAALVASYRHDFERWTTEVDEALSLNPNFAPALSLRANLRIYTGTPRAAIADLRRAMQLDPTFIQNYLHHLGMAHAVAGDDAAAETVLRERIMLVPGTDMSRASLCAALGNLGRIEEAQRVWADLVAVDPTFSPAGWLRRMPFRRQEDRARIAEGLERAGLLETGVLLP